MKLAKLFSIKDGIIKQVPVRKLFMLQSRKL